MKCFFPRCIQFRYRYRLTTSRRDSKNLVDRSRSRILPGHKNHAIAIPCAEATRGRAEQPTTENLRWPTTGRYFLELAPGKKTDVLAVRRPKYVPGPSVRGSG